MDNSNPTTPDNLSTHPQQQRNGSDAVASLISALLDDITVEKVANSMPIGAVKDLAAPKAAEGDTKRAPSHDVLPTVQTSAALNGSINGEPQHRVNGFQTQEHSSHTNSTSEFPSVYKDGMGERVKEIAPATETIEEHAVPLPASETKIPIEQPLSESELSSLPIEALPVDQAPTNQEAYQGDGMAINIKGRADGVLVEIGRGNWEILLEALRNRLAQAGGFFRGGNVALDLGDRSLPESDLRLLCDLLVSYSMKPVLVRTASDRTFQSALMIGLAGTLESIDGRPLETVQAAASNQESQTHYVYRGALRSGQVLKRRSHVLIVGDVNAGSEVIATGDILIWGRLRGSAHAGVEGDKRAVVAAFDIDPVQLRIADVVAVGNNSQSEQGYRWGWSRNSEKRPEVARLVNGQIAIEPWDEAKTGGSPVLKKRR